MLKDPLIVAGIFKDKVFIGPRSVSLDLTDACNYNCVFCIFHREGSLSKDGPRHIDFGVFKKIIDDCALLKVRNIKFVGLGEPFMHPQIYEMIEYTKSKNLRVSIDTNGSFNRDKVLTVSKVDSFNINFSAATEETYKKFQSGVAGSFKKVLTNIKLLSRIRGRKGFPEINIAYMLHAFNYAETEKMIQLCKVCKVDSVQFKPVMVYPGMEKLILSERDVNVLLPLLKKIINRKSSFLKKTNIRQLYGVISGMRNGNYEITNLPRQGQDSEMINYNKIDFKDGFQCYIGWYQANINLDGDVYPCCIHKTLTAGNIYQESFRDIWLGKKFSRIRSRFKYSFDIKDKVWQRCHNCCDYELVSGAYLRLVRKLSGSGKKKKAQ